MATSGVSTNAAPSLVARRRATTGWTSWLTTTDHKKIGILCFWTVLVFLTLGGLEARVVRAQLAQAELGVVSEEIYNQMFTTHGLTMIFLVVMPLGAAFLNYLIPLQIGARDVAGGGQLRHHDPEHARPGHDVHADAGVHLDVAGDQLAPLTEGDDDPAPPTADGPRTPSSNGGPIST